MKKKKKKKKLKNGDLNKTRNNLNMPVILVERKRVKRAVDLGRLREGLRSVIFSREQAFYASSAPRFWAAIFLYKATYCLALFPQDQSCPIPVATSFRQILGSRR